MTRETMAPEQPEENWVNNKWRPAIAWLYIVVCISDFVLAPVGWSILQSMYNGIVTQQWVPLTLGGGGLFHVSMGAILGVTSWSRGREKLNGVAGAGLR